MMEFQEHITDDIIDGKFRSALSTIRENIGRITMLDLQEIEDSIETHIGYRPRIEVTVTVIRIHHRGDFYAAII